MTDTASTTPKPFGRQTLFWFVGFFAAFIIVDVLFVTVALKTNAGIVTERAYEKGLNYNDTLDRAAAQQALGWNGTLTHDGTAGALLFTLTDAQNRPLGGADVQASLIQPGNRNADTTLPLQEKSPGHYMMSTDGLDGGQWHVRIYATWNNKQYQLGRTTILLPRR